MVHFEKQTYGSESKGEGYEARQIEKLSESLGEVAEHLQENDGLPVNPVSCCVDMGDSSFEKKKTEDGEIGAHSKDRIQEDIEFAKREAERDGKRYELDISAEEFDGNLLDDKREQLEVATVLMFFEFLKKEFIVVRASPHDRHENGVGILIIHRDTGNVVCGITETEDKKGEGVEGLESNVVETNAGDRGVYIDYGFRLERKEGGKSRFAPAALSNVPVFYLPLSSDYVTRVRNAMTGSSDKAALSERDEFARILSLLLDEEIPDVEDGLRQQFGVVRGGTGISELNAVQGRVNTFRDALKGARDSLGLSDVSLGAEKREAA
ncbi:hypothetical protein CL629_01815 [bacterium]|nr:hypothetical protein [bacterium]|tara:strand:- start:3487 stop:4455 length:969 start_codon:yes stop_codon:yes gene_type:complete